VPKGIIELLSTFLDEGINSVDIADRPSQVKPLDLTKSGLA